MAVDVDEGASYPPVTPHSALRAHACRALPLPVLGSFVDKLLVWSREELGIAMKAEEFHVYNFAKARHLPNYFRFRAVS